MGGSDKKETIF